MDRLNRPLLSRRPKFRAAPWHSTARPGKRKCAQNRSRPAPSNDYYRDPLRYFPDLAKLIPEEWPERCERHLPGPACSRVAIQLTATLSRSSRRKVCQFRVECGGTRCGFIPAITTAFRASAPRAYPLFAPTALPPSCGSSRSRPEASARHVRSVPAPGLASKSRLPRVACPLPATAGAPPAPRPPAGTDVSGWSRPDRATILVDMNECGRASRIDTVEQGRLVLAYFDVSHVTGNE